jgi:hypothetical protein
MNEPWTDEDLLKALDLRDHEGLTMEVIGQRLGRNRNAVIGALSRVGAAMKDDNGVGNGTMPRKWWKR